MTSAPLDTMLRQLRDWHTHQVLGDVSDSQLLQRFTARREEAAFAAVGRGGRRLSGASRRHTGLPTEHAGAFSGPPPPRGPGEGRPRGKNPPGGGGRRAPPAGRASPKKGRGPPAGKKKGEGGSG